MDDLPIEQYMEMYNNVRNDRTLREVVAELRPHGCTLSIAAWSKIERGILGLNRESRNALRRHAGLPDVPPSPAEIVESAGVQRVMQVSDDPDTALLIGREVHQVTLRENGKNRVTGMPPEVHVTPVTRTRNRPARKGYTTTYVLGARLSARKERLDLTWEKFFKKQLDDSIFLDAITSPVLSERLSARKERLGLTWKEFFQKLLNDSVFLDAMGGYDLPMDKKLSEEETHGSTN